MIDLKEQITQSADQLEEVYTLGSSGKFVGKAKDEGRGKRTEEKG